jgi:hypothetical protein
MLSDPTPVLYRKVRRKPHQVLAPLGQQMQHRRLVLDPDLPQGGRVVGGDRH